MKEEKGKRKPKYGYVAWKYFAYMGVIGLIGLSVAITGTLLNFPLNIILILIGAPTAFVGLYIAASYLILYHRFSGKETFKICGQRPWNFQKE